MKRHTYKFSIDQDGMFGALKRFHAEPQIETPQTRKRKTHQESVSFPPSPIPPPIPHYTSSHFMLEKLRNEKDDALRALKMAQQKEEEMKMREMALQEELRRRDIQIAMQKDIYFQEMSRMQMAYEQKVTNTGQSWVV